MRVLALSDIHGATGELEAILGKEDDYDLVLVAGDITDTAEDDYEGTAQDVIDLLDEQGRFVQAVPGNMDDESILELLIEHRINLHKNIFSMEDCEFIGFGGGRTPFGTPFEPGDEERGQVVQQLLQRTTSDRRAIVSHEPPRDTAADVTSDGDHVGSAALRDIIAGEDVAFVLCGHIHESRTVDEVDGTTVVNPGPVNDGKYAILDVDGGVEAELRE